MSERNALLRRSSSLLAAVCFVVVCAVGARASDAWKDKEPESWDAKDVQKILTDSPWSKQLQFGIRSDGSLTPSYPSMGTSAVAETSGSSSNGTRPGAGPGPRDNGPTGGSSDFSPSSKFTVSWHSSVTVREALVREKELSGGLPDQARKDLAAKYDSYQITISGADLRAFSKEGAESLKARSYLAPKNSKEKISPSNVVVQTRQDGSIVAILFDFPQKTAAGQPTIAAGEKSVEFAARVGDIPVKVTFDISKMSTKQGPDL